MDFLELIRAFSTQSVNTILCFDLQNVCIVTVDGALFILLELELGRIDG